MPRRSLGSIARRLLRPAVLGVCLLFLLASIALAWVWWRSRTTVDDVFVIYRGTGHERLRSWDGMVWFQHVEPEPDKPRAAIERVSRNTYRLASIYPPDLLPPKYPYHRQWGPFRFDAVTAEEVARSRAAEQAARQFARSGQAQVLTAYRAAELAAAKLSDEPPPHAPADVEQVRALEKQADQLQRLWDLAQNPPPASPHLATPRWQVAAPVWGAAALAATPMALWLGGRTAGRAFVRRRRRRRGLCLRCGYDLRGNESGRCSECGAEVVKKPATAVTRAPT
jgi:hypothetical protein